MTDTRGTPEYETGDKIKYILYALGGSQRFQGVVDRVVGMVSGYRYDIRYRGEDGTYTQVNQVHPADLEPLKKPSLEMELAEVERAMRQTGMPKPVDRVGFVSLPEWVAHAGRTFEELREDLHSLRTWLIELGASEGLTVTGQVRQTIERLQAKIHAPTELEQSITDIMRQHGPIDTEVPTDVALEQLLNKDCNHPPTRFVQEHKLRQNLRDELLVREPLSDSADDQAKAFVTILRSLGLGVVLRDPDTAETLPPSWEDVKDAFREMGDKVSEAMRDIAREAGK